MLKEDFNYGLLTTTPTNIGEEIQSLAAMRFLPRIDEYLHREHLKKYKTFNNKKTKLIMNAWWLWNKKGFPPSQDVLPLLISMYIRVELRKNFLTDKTREYLIAHGPVGCRDLSTFNWLKSENIPAYFSGCLTLALCRNPELKRGDYILCVDIKDSVINEIKKRTNKPVYSINVDLQPVFTPKQRLEIAQIYLALYHNAHCVISNRLHVVLPCLAFDTPILKLDSGEKERNIKSRYSGYEDFAHTCTIDDFLKNRDLYDVNNPPKNPQKYLELRKKIIEDCKKFTGFDSEKSFVYSKNDALFKLIGFLTFNPDIYLKSICRIKTSNLLKEYLEKAILKKKPYSEVQSAVKSEFFC